ncbi:ABC transporter permease [Candidatus Dojkabacteria bacterium]|jgi:ABC-type transport system involved in multi-copper enzyme maturation permease subunit|nr:ABC transporter permease [Candidatus Dojkabacteria bacterium]
MKNIWQLFKVTIRNKKSLFITLTIINVVLVLLYVAIWPSLGAQMADLSKLFTTMPEPILKAFNMSANFNVGFESLIVSKQFGLVLPILALILTNGLAVNAIAGEIEYGTINLYLSQPISRTNYYCSRYFADLFMIIIFSICSVLVTIPFGRMFNIDINVSHYLVFTLSTILFSWTIFSIGYFASAIFSEGSKVTMITVGVFLVSYVLNVISQLSSSLSNLKYISLMYYFGPATQLVQYSVLIFILLITLFSVLGFLIFKNRDISLK